MRIRIEGAGQRRETPSKAATVLLAGAGAAGWAVLAGAGTWLGAAVAHSAPDLLRDAYWCGLAFALAVAAAAVVQALRAR